MNSMIMISGRWKTLKHFSKYLRMIVHNSFINFVMLLERGAHAPSKSKGDVPGECLIIHVSNFFHCGGKEK